MNSAEIKKILKPDLKKIAVFLALFILPMFVTNFDLSFEGLIAYLVALYAVSCFLVGMLGKMKEDSKSEANASVNLKSENE